MDKEIALWMHVDSRPAVGGQLQEAVDAVQKGMLVRQYTSPAAALGSLVYNEHSQRTFRPVLLTIHMGMENNHGLDFLMALKEIEARHRPAVILMGGRDDWEALNLPLPFGVSGCAVEPASGREWLMLAHDLLELYNRPESLEDSSASAFFQAA